jgi:hypothetical protein
MNHIFPNVKRFHAYEKAHNTIGPTRLAFSELLGWSVEVYCVRYTMMEE